MCFVTSLLSRRLSVLVCALLLSGAAVTSSARKAEAAPAVTLGSYSVPLVVTYSEVSGGKIGDDASGFDLLSSASKGGLDAGFDGSATRSEPLSAGSALRAQGSSLVNGATIGTSASVISPEPTALPLLMAGVPLLGITVRRRLRRG